MLWSSPPPSNTKVGLARLLFNQFGPRSIVFAAHYLLLPLDAWSRVSSQQVKVLEVSRNKDGEFTQVARAMTLSGGHTKAVHGVSFSPDSTRVVTASVDGTWCVKSTISQLTHCFFYTPTCFIAIPGI